MVGAKFKKGEVMAPINKSYAILKKKQKNKLAVMSQRTVFVPNQFLSECLQLG